MTVAFTFLLALFRAVPALEGVVRDCIAQRDAERVREASARHTAKDNAVDAAIGAPFDEQLPKS